MSDKRKLDPLGGIAIVVGSILGSGIFIAPSLIATFSCSLWITSAFWIVGGLVCMAGAVIYGGLGLLYPQTGGQYVYLRETMGARYSRFYGWASIFVLCPTMLASMALFFAVLCEDVLPGTSLFARPVAIFILVLFTFLNTWGLEISGWIQKALVLIHVALFLGVAAIATVYLPNSYLGSYAHAKSFTETSSLSGGVLALAAVLWSFEGFNSITFLTGEIEGGEKNVRGIALWGCGITLVLYLLFNAVTLANIAPNILPAQANVASYLMGAIYGSNASWTIFFLVALGVATVIHSSIIIGPRVVMATVRDAGVFTRLARADRRTGTPKGALWFQCALACAFVGIGHFDSLMTAFIVLNWLFHGLVAIGYWRVRGQAGKRIRVTDAVCVVSFVAMVSLLIVSQLLDNPRTALLGLAVFVLGLYWPSKKARA